MSRKKFLIFGCGEYAQQIARNLIDSGRKLRYFSLDAEEIEALSRQGIDAAPFDLEDEWSDLGIEDEKDYIVYCALCDEAENIFLTISLRTLFSQITIIALASDREHATKLKMAGADKTIVTAQITANLLYERISNPTASQLLQKILYENSDLSIAQIAVASRSELVGMRVAETRGVQDRYGIILLAVIDAQMQTRFAFLRKGLEHTIAEQDILIVIGEEPAIRRFQEATGEHYATDWHHWKWFDDGA